MRSDRSRWLHPLTVAAASAVIFAGCDVSTSDHLFLTFDAPGVDIDFECSNGGCDRSDRTPATIFLEDAPQVPVDGEVNITEYNVVYQFDGAPPSFSAATSVIVEKGDRKAFSPRIAGPDQRSWALGQSGGAEIAGLALLTVTGTDQDDEVVQTSASIEIVFSDFVDTETGSGSGTATSGAGGSSSSAGGAGGAGGN